MGKYDNMIHEDEERIIADIIQEEGRNLLSVPGVWEVVREHFNNEMLDRWEKEQEEKNAED
ncbi:MAG TPA: hypothetical protein VMW95_04850 [Desulfobacterales bacterium]|nr:hypothetical protein [Desulfobacterales bacterium]